METINEYFSLLSDFKLYILKIHLNATKVEIMNDEKVCLIPGFYLKNYKQLTVKGFLSADVVLIGILYVLLLSVPLQLLPLGLTIEFIVAFLGIGYFGKSTTSAYERDLRKSIFPRGLSQRDFYLKAHTKFLLLIMFITVLLNVALFVIDVGFRYTMESYILDSAVSKVAYILQLSMYAVEVMILTIVYILTRCILFYNTKPLVEFYFSQRSSDTSDVKPNGIELRRDGVTVKIINEKEEKFFIEDNGIVLVFNKLTKELKSFLSLDVTSIALLKNDDSLFAELRFINGKWVRF